MGTEVRDMALSRRALLASLAAPLMPKEGRNKAWNEFTRAEELLWEALKDIHAELKKFEKDQFVLSVDLVRLVKTGKARLKAVNKAWGSFEDEIGGY